MASPQLEDGYTRIANELVDALARVRLAGQEGQVVWSVIRLTYGFCKKCDRISHGTISRATGIPRPKVVVLVKGLVLKKVLSSTNNGTRCASTIGINKDYSEWLPSPKKGTIPHIGTIPSPNNGTKPSPNNGTLQRKKESIKKKETLSSFDSANDPCPHQSIIALYHEILPELPAVKLWNEPRQAFLRQRWKEDACRQNLDWWRKYFSDVKESDFLTGRSGSFVASLEWLVRPKNMPKVIEGNYRNRQAVTMCDINPEDPWSFS